MRFLQPVQKNPIQNQAFDFDYEFMGFED